MNAVIIIPAYQPEKNLIKIVDYAWKLVRHIIVVDDGSTADKKDVFNCISEKATVLHHEKNQGKGSAIKSAIRYIIENLNDCDVIGIMDADGQHLPEDMENLLMKVESNDNTLVLGVRNIGRDMPLKSRIGNKITRLIFMLLSGEYVSDTQTGLRTFKKNIAERFLKIEGSRYEYETNVLFTCAKEKIQIIEVPIHTIYHDVNNSCSHFHPVKDSIRIYKDILKFSISSLSSFFIDYVFFCLLVMFMPGNTLGRLIANVTARMISGTYNYYINCKFVFYTKRTLHTGFQYLLLAALILLLNNIVLTFYADICAIPALVAKVLTEISLFIVSFIIQKRKIFVKIRQEGN